MPMTSAIGAAPRAPFHLCHGNIVTRRHGGAGEPLRRKHDSLRPRVALFWHRAVVVVEAQPSDIVTETITMIILAIVASLGAIAVLFWLLFTLAVFALPLFVGATLGLWAHGTGAGILGGVIFGAFAAAATFGLFQLLLLFVRPAWLKLLILLVFVAPAVVAGYHATFGIVKLTMPSETWQVIFAVAGAIAVGITAFMRLTMMAPPEPAEQGIARAS